MKYRRLGKTDIEVSELVFGAGWVGGILIHQDDETKLKAVRMALDGGINFIDTAASYGGGKSEEALGWLLNEVEATPTVATKVAIDTDRLDDIPGQIERGVHESLRRLRRESVDILHLHNLIEPETGAQALGLAEILRDGGVADGLDRMRDQGLTAHVGFTALGDAASCRAVIESGRVETAQVYYNMLNPSAGRAMPDRWTGQDFAGLIAACRANDVGVMNIRVFAAGVLASEARTGREVVITKESPLAEEERKAAAIFDMLGDAHGTRAQTALRFSLSNPDLSCVVLGLAELSHLEEALTAAERGPLPPDAMARLDGLYRTDFRDT